MQGKTTFFVLQKNTRSMNSSKRLEELFSEVHQVAWDAILISETWRQGKEIWETQQGHIMVESGKFTNKHGVAILLNRRWRNQTKWVQCACERVECFHASQWLSGPPSRKSIQNDPHDDRERRGDFNAELGPGEGIELSAVRH